MDRIIRRLYAGIIQELTPNDRLVQEQKAQILSMMKEERGSMTEQEFELYRSKVFQIAAVAEEYGFIRGFKWGMRLYQAWRMYKCNWTRGRFDKFKTAADKIYTF